MSVSHQCTLQAACGATCSSSLWLNLGGICILHRGHSCNVMHMATWSKHPHTLAECHGGNVVCRRACLSAASTCAIGTPESIAQLFTASARCKSASAFARYTTCITAASKLCVGVCFCVYVCVCAYGAANQVVSTTPAVPLPGRGAAAQLHIGIMHV